MVQDLDLDPWGSGKKGQGLDVVPCGAVGKAELHWACDAAPMLCMHWR